jgi:TPR repeat protein
MPFMVVAAVFQLSPAVEARQEESTGDARFPLRPEPELRPRQEMCASVSACEAACQSGRAEGCARLGELLLWSKDRESAKVLDSLRRGCDLGSAGGCYRLGSLHEQGFVAGHPLPGLASVSYARACDGSDALACEALARLVLSGAGVPRDVPRAIALLEKACTRSLASACGTLGGLYQTDATVRDEARAAQLLEKGCELGSEEACSRLGALLEVRKSPPADEVRAAELDARACDARQMDACYRLALLYRDGRGVAGADQTRSLALLTAACEAGESQACWDLAVMHRDGRGVSKDRARAVSLFERACERNSPAACWEADCVRDGMRQVSPAARTREDRVRLAVIKSLLEDRRGRGVSLYVHPCGEPSAFLRARLRERVGSMRTDTDLQELWVGPVQWSDDTTARVSAGAFASLHGRPVYVVKRGLFGKWRVAAIMPTD